MGVSRGVLRRVLICVGVLLSVAGLSACGGGGDGSSVSGGGGGGGTITTSNITLPTSVQVVSAN